MRRLLLAGTALVAVVNSSAAQSAPPITGFSADGARAQAATEQRLAALLSRDSTKRWFRFLTDAPHPAGSARNKHLADTVAARFKAYGWDDVRMHRYDVLLPWPTTVRVQLLTPTRAEATLAERCYKEDAKSCVGKELTYSGMSASYTR